MLLQVNKLQFSEFIVNLKDVLYRNIWNYKDYGHPLKLYTGKKCFVQTRKGLYECYTEGLSVTCNPVYIGDIKFVCISEFVYIYTDELLLLKFENNKWRIKWKRKWNICKLGPNIYQSNTKVYKFTNEGKRTQIIFDTWRPGSTIKFFQKDKIITSNWLYKETDGIVDIYNGDKLEKTLHGQVNGFGYRILSTNNTLFIESIFPKSAIHVFKTDKQTDKQLIECDSRILYFNVSENSKYLCISTREQIFVYKFKYKYKLIQTIESTKELECFIDNRGNILFIKDRHVNFMYRKNNAKHVKMNRIVPQYEKRSLRNFSPKRKS